VFLKCCGHICKYSNTVVHSDSDSTTFVVEYLKEVSLSHFYKSWKYYFSFFCSAFTAIKCCKVICKFWSLASRQAVNWHNYLSGSTTSARFQPSGNSSLPPKKVFLLQKPPCRIGGMGTVRRGCMQWVSKIDTFHPFRQLFLMLCKVVSSYSTDNRWTWFKSQSSPERLSNCFVILAAIWLELLKCRFFTYLHWCWW